MEVCVLMLSLKNINCNKFLLSGSVKPGKQPLKGMDLLLSSGHMRLTFRHTIVWIFGAVF